MAPVLSKLYIIPNGGEYGCKNIVVDTINSFPRNPSLRYTLTQQFTLSVCCNCFPGSAETLIMGWERNTPLSYSPYFISNISSKFIKNRLTCGHTEYRKENKTNKAVKMWLNCQLQSRNCAYVIKRIWLTPYRRKAKFTNKSTFRNIWWRIVEYSPSQRRIHCYCLNETQKCKTFAITDGNNCFT